MEIREIIFIIFTILVLVLNGACAALQIGLLQRRKPWPKFLGIAIGIWAGLMVCLFLLELHAPEEWKPWMRHWLYFPLAVEMVWNLILLPVLACALIVVTLALLIFRPVKTLAPSAPVDPSRRQFLYLMTCGAAPAVALGAGVHGVLSEYDLRVTRYDIPIAGLSPELEGFTISHVSDLHSGIFCSPKRLKIISDATNDLKADLVAVTGDIINDDMSELPASVEALQRIESRYGLYLCEGNHDVFPGPGLVHEACLENHLPMLFESSQIIPIHGCRLILGGLPWLGRHFIGTPDLVDQLYPRRQPGDVRILLAHHPQHFDIAGSTDLVLAGHTHGGQIMFGSVGFGPLFFKYWSGFYRHPSSNTSLVVSNGAGDWFPCRIGAPAEIGLLRLTAAKATV